MARRPYVYLWFFYLSLAYALIFPGSAFAWGCVAFTSRILPLRISLKLILAVLFVGRLFVFFDCHLTFHREIHHQNIFEDIHFQLKERIQQPQSHALTKTIKALQNYFQSKIYSRYVNLKNFREAFFMGKARALSKELWESLNGLGLSHAIVVSGSHLSLLASVLIFLIGALFRWMRWDGIYFRRVFVVIGLLGFSIICGFEITLLRALLCFFILYVGGGFYPALHRYSSLDRLAMVGLLMGFIWPGYLLSRSYLLSFAATFVLLSFSGRTWCCLAVSVFMPIFCLLLGLSAHPLSFIFNIIFLPALIFIVVPLSAASVFLRPLESLANNVVIFFEEFVGWTYQISASLIKAPVGSENLFQLTLSLLIVGVLLTRRSEKIKMSVLIGTSFLGLLFPIRISDTGNAHRVLVRPIDIGQGDGIVIQVESHTFVIDGGDERARSKIITKLPRSKQTIWVVSHFDRDHIGALIGIESIMGWTAVWATRKDPRFSKIFPVDCREGGCLWCGESYCVEAWAPRSQTADGPVRNHESLVLMIYEKGTKRLRAAFLGDHSIAGEKKWIRSLAQRGLIVDGSIDLLKLGHHGSRSSSGEDLLKFLRPKLSILTCGRSNRYGHPHEEVLERLESYSLSVLRTDQVGDFEVFF